MATPLRLPWAPWTRTAGLAACLLLPGMAPDTLSAEDAGDGKSPGIVLFEQQVQPALVKHCYRCHSQKGEDIGGGLELDSPTGLFRGGDSGPAVIPHEPDKSPLIRMLRHDDDVSAMPPESKLTDQVVSAFAEWVRLGAPDPRKASGPTAKQQRLEAGQSHWAFQPPRAAAPPRVRQENWPRGMIDRFMLARMEAEGVQPVADASRRALARRIYFDLIGLPPSPAEIDAFLTDESPAAVAHLVDRLLDSPRFGERWGRHWLDVVRYAESSGMEFNFTYPHAWPYRNYVIDSLNQDKPYDEFVRRADCRRPSIAQRKRGARIATKRVWSPRACWPLAPNVTTRAGRNFRWMSSTTKSTPSSARRWR